MNFEGLHYNKSQIKAILDFIDNQPTVYNVEKVVKQLEDMSDDIELQYEYNYERGVSDGLDKAIEIVKQGGIETDDVCEWKCYKDGIEYTYTLGCNNRVFSQGYETETKYCPCCGKKIKVVD